jgi:hypothetical protein
LSIVNQARREERAMTPTDPQHEARREAFEAACAQLARQAAQQRSHTMANATTSPKRPSNAPPTPKATAEVPAQLPAAGQTPPPATTETRVLPNGTIERYANGQLLKTTPPPQANGKAPATPAAKAPVRPTCGSLRSPAAAPAPAMPAAQAPTGPQPGQLFHVATLGTEDIWEFAPQSAAPGAAVMVRHVKGYEMNGA